MCGIAGIASLTRQPIQGLSSKLARMGVKVSHRGPDDKGYWQAPDGSVGIFHARLRINGDQPQPLALDDWCLAYNGELYGVGEDTVHLAAFMLEGRPLAELQGMFAFAWYHRGSITLVRDRLGVKPMYYSRQGDLLYFASEAKALVHLGGEMDHDWLTDYKAFQVGLEGRTPWKHIKELRPGHVLRDGEESRWWAPEFGNRHPRDHVGDIRDLLQQAVIDAMPEDGGACYISGGIDSGVVAAISRLPGYTGFIKDYDEHRYAVAIAMENYITLDTVVIDGSGFLGDMGRVLQALDYPVAGPGSYSQYKMAERVSKSEKVVLSGCGGDEVFNGYARMAAAYGDPLPRGYDALHRSLWGVEGIAERYRRSVTRGTGRRDWFYDTIWDNRHPTNSMQRFELEVLLPGLLQVEDRVSMAFGLETRVPLLDHRLVEYVLSLSSGLRYDGSLKRLLKQSSRGLLPEAVLMRKDKMGFPTPWWQWAGISEDGRNSWGEWCLQRWSDSL